MSESAAVLDKELEQAQTSPEENVQGTPVVEATGETMPTEKADTSTAASEEVPSVELPAQENESPEETPERGDPATGAKKPQLPYHERYYLRYREGKRTARLDLAGTHAFLRDLGFDGGELRQARQGKDCAEEFRNADKNSIQMRCSYCGAEISGVDFYRMPDGRLRCTGCSNTVVNSKTEMEELCKKVVANMENFFGATIRVPISIEVLDERKLKKKIGASIGSRDDQSILILGVAINKKKKYTILLENGAPRISLIATFAHELTHIWQYTNWDKKKGFKKCSKSKKLLIYEGMAKWAEIQYLYLMGETAVARREELITRNRQDEYGAGFCLYEDHFPLSREAMTCGETPFVPGKYPFD